MNAELLTIICFSMLVTSILLMFVVIGAYAKVGSDQCDLFADLDARLR